jgi:hypothetical protein
MVNQLAYYMLSLKAAPRALALFQLNVCNYPASFGVHNSLVAVAQALKLKESPEIWQKLTKLQAKK